MEQPFRLYMAPMKGFTDHLFRTAFADHFGGFDLAVAPFITSKQDNTFKKKYVKDLLPENNDSLPVVPQILSKSAKDFTALANYLFELGYSCVNWNLGCPSPMVAGKQRGSGMLPHTDRIRAFLDHASAHMKGALSIKIRLGWQSADDIFRLLPVLNQYPLEALIIHPRTGKQRYEGEVDLDAFERCLSNAKHSIVYNGDIRTPADFKRLSRRFDRVNQWMIGRGCLADPFLPAVIKSGKDEIPNKIQTLKLFHEDLYDAYLRALDGPSHVLNKMKGLWRYFSLPFKDSKKAVKQIQKSSRPDQYIARVNHFFETGARLRSETS